MKPRGLEDFVELKVVQEKQPDGRIRCCYASCPHSYFWYEDDTKARFECRVCKKELIRPDECSTGDEYDKRGYRTCYACISKLCSQCWKDHHEECTGT